MSRTYRRKGSSRGTISQRIEQERDRVRAAHEKRRVTKAETEASPLEIEKSITGFTAKIERIVALDEAKLMQHRATTLQRRDLDPRSRQRIANMTLEQYRNTIIRFWKDRIARSQKKLHRA